MSAWETFRRSLRRREPSTPWLSPEDTYGSAGRDVAEVTGRPRRLRPFWSQLGWALASPEARAAKKAVAGWNQALDLGEQAVAERDAAVKERDEMAEGIRLALISGGYFQPITDLVAGVRHMAGEYVSTVAELRAAKDRASDLAAEVAGLTLALDAARLRPSDTSDQDRRNCVDMSDQLAAVRREKDDLERRVFELEGRAAKPDVIEGGRLP